MLSALPAKIPLDNNADIKAEPEEHLVKNINPYLVAAPDLFVDKRMKPLAVLPPAVRGSQPTDDGHLIVEPEDYDSVMADPIAAKYVRPFRMGRELIHGDERWCLWLEDAPDSDLEQSPIIRERVQNCAAYRAAAPKGGDAYKRLFIIGGVVGVWACEQVIDGLFMRLLSRPLGVVRIRWGICRRGWCGCGGGL